MVNLNGHLRAEFGTIWLLKKHRNIAPDLELQVSSWQVHPKVASQQRCAPTDVNLEGHCQGSFQALSIKLQLKYGSMQGQQTAQMTLANKLSLESQAENLFHW